MAQPITDIHRPAFTEEQQTEMKLNNLKKQFANNEEGLNKILDIIEELNDIGVLEAADAMLHAKENIAKIILEQVSREPVTNLLNTIIGATGEIMSSDPEQTKALISSALAGINEGHQFIQADKKIRVIDLMKTLKDPDINRAIGFGIYFLKGMGQQLKE